MLHLLLEADEPTRRAAAPKTQKLLKTTSKVVQDGDTYRMDARHAAATLAAFGTGTAAQAAAAGWLADDGAHRAVARSRPRAWQQELAERASVRAWPLIRGLVREGLIDEPRTDEHVLGMISNRPRRGRSVPVALLEWLREDHELLETTVWRIFEVEGGGEDSLAAYDKYSGYARSWTHALTELAATGELDRQRLLDGALAALRRDWAPFRAQWMTAFHAALEPTLDEQQARAGQYAALLAAQAPPVVSFAVKTLSVLHKAGRLDAELLLRCSAPAVVARAKGTATTAVRLVAACSDADRELAQQVLGAALASEHPQVKQAAQNALTRLTGRAAPPARVRNGAVAVAPPRRDVTLPVDITGRRALVRVRDLEDLTARLVAVLERADDPDELELVLDGLSRLGAEPGVDQALALVARRAAALAKREGDAVPTVLARVVDAWATRTPRALTTTPSDGREVSGSARLQLLRLSAVVDRLAARGSAPLVACPTHDGGWLDPDVLLARLEVTPNPADVELAVALLRLPQPLGDKRLDAAVARVSARGRLPRRQPSGPAVEAAKGTEPALRIEVTTEPNTHRFLAVRPAAPVPLDLHAPIALWDDGSWARWTATVWPRGVRVRDAMAAELLAEDLDWWGARWGAVALLEPLLDPDRPLTPEGCVLLALGLLCKESGQRRLAVDAFVQAAEDGGLRGPALADALALVLPVTLASRLQAAFTEAARAGEVPALVARDALLGVLPRSDPAQKGMPGLAGLLADLAETHGLPADEALQGWLAGRGGDLGKQAKRLLQSA